MENIMKNSMFHSWSRAAMFLFKGHLLCCHPLEWQFVNHQIWVEFHEASPVLNYVFVCSCVLNPLRKRVSNKCMGIYIFIRNFGGKGYLARLGTIPSVMPFPAIIALHTCYTLFSITLSFCFLAIPLPVRSFEGHADLSWPVCHEKVFCP